MSDWNSAKKKKKNFQCPNPGWMLTQYIKTVESLSNGFEKNMATDSHKDAKSPRCHSKQNRNALPSVICSTFFVSPKETNKDVLISRTLIKKKREEKRINDPFDEKNKM